MKRRVVSVPGKDSAEGSIPVESGTSIIVVLTSQEAQTVVNCLLNCPIQTDVKSMPALLGLVQGIVRKLQAEMPTQPPTPAAPTGA